MMRIIIIIKSIAHLAPVSRTGIRNSLSKYGVLLRNVEASGHIKLQSSGAPPPFRPSPPVPSSFILILSTSLTPLQALCSFAFDTRSSFCCLISPVSLLWPEQSPVHIKVSFKPKVNPETLFLYQHFSHDLASKRQLSGSDRQWFGNPPAAEKAIQKRKESKLADFLCPVRSPHRHTD